MPETIQEYAKACEHAALFDLSARGKVELAGPDARLFLHNLCTNDVKNLAMGSGCEAFLCTAKARVVSYILAGYFHAGDQDVIWLDCDPGCGDKVFQHLDHFLISERVELADRTQELSLLRLCGPRAEAILQSYFGTALANLPALHHHRSILPGSGGEAVYVRRQNSVSLPGFDLLCSAAVAPKLRQDLLALEVIPAGHETHEMLRIEAGTPVFGPDIDENRLVMEVGRTEQAICYTKGCFLGQEPIVMARDRGHVNRWLLGIKVADGDALKPGSRLFRGTDEVGQVTSSVRSPRLGQIIALAYLRRGNWDAGTMLTVEPESDGRSAEVAALPFLSSS